MPLLINCPGCAKPFRLGENVPDSFSCTRCGREMDLSRYARVAANDVRGPSRKGSPAHSKPSSAVAPPPVAGGRKRGAQVGSVLLTILTLGVLAVRIVRCSSKSQNSGMRNEINPAALDDVLHRNESPEMREFRLRVERGSR